MNRFKFFFVVIMLTVVQFSCNKDEKKLSSKLEGRWELRTEISGQTGARTNYEINNGRILQFSANEYQVTAENKTIKKGYYTVERKISKIFNKEESYIVYDGEKDAIRQIYRVYRDELSLTIDANDGPTVIYGRIN